MTAFHRQILLIPSHEQCVEVHGIAKLLGFEAGIPIWMLAVVAAGDSASSVRPEHCPD